MSQKIKKFTQAPLPFMGQKRRFLKQVVELINNCPNDTIFVDLFGGSGLLSYTIKHTKPNSTVVYNDFDNYRERLKHANQTNQLLSKIREILKNAPKDKKINDELKQQILLLVEEEDKKGFVDYITLSSNLLFSMNYVTSFEALKKESFYKTIRNSDYYTDGYLDGLIITQLDYRELFNQYKDYKNVIFLVDPPYLSTETGSYKNYWKLKDYLDVLDVLDGTNYVYFTSNKSNIVELCEWMSDKPALYNPFKGSTVQTTSNTLNWTSSYTDIMLHKVNYELK